MVALAGSTKARLIDEYVKLCAVTGAGVERGRAACCFGLPNWLQMNGAGIHSELELQHEARKNQKNSCT